MNIVVLIKQTFDTEERIQLVDENVSEEGVKHIINPYDEYAVEEAIRWRDELGGKTTVITVGPDRCTEALRTALAMGIDEAVHIQDDRIGTDERAISQVLAAYLSQIDYDVILGGNFSIDHGAGQVAIRVAGLLDIPHISAITKLHIDPVARQVDCERDAEGDTSKMTAGLPVLLTTQQGLNEPRYPSLPGIMKAKRKPYIQLSLADIPIDEAKLLPSVSTLKRVIPQKSRANQIFTGEINTQVQQLIHQLTQVDKVL